MFSREVHAGSREGARRQGVKRDARRSRETPSRVLAKSSGFFFTLKKRKQPGVLFPADLVSARQCGRNGNGVIIIRAAEEALVSTLLSLFINRS